MDPTSHSTNDDFLIDVYYECQFRPVQIAVGPDGALYATGYRGEVNQYGTVARIAPDRESGAMTEVEIAHNLNRPHGLAFYDGDLYVSRSGHYTRAKFGKLTETNTGAVTLLRDTDGDGVMDYYHDVVADLPGAQGPDELHQNNGITFGPKGYMYCTVGAHSDIGPVVGPLEGTIVRSRPDGSNMAVFARGFRNPFDVAIGPRGELFCTDNDPSERRSGDELNHVVKDGHYGFPYADGALPHPDGTTGPLLVHKDGTLQGLAYTNSPGLPEKYRDCLYAASYQNGEIFRIVLHRDGKTFRAESTIFARIPGALDIAIDQAGTFYVSCVHTRKIYRLRYRGTNQ